MKLVYAKSHAEMRGAPLDDFLVRAKLDGYEAVEMSVRFCQVESGELRRKLEEYGLSFIAQVATVGERVEEHLESLKHQCAFAADAGAILINAHTGREIFPFEQNCRLFELGVALHKEYGISFVNETHRGRALYSAVDTVKYIEAVPEMRLNADFSHWMCVHESNLSDQMFNVERAIERTFYIHARVGCNMSPQVAHPLAPEAKPWLEVHMNLWRRILEERKQQHYNWFAIMPDFASPPYMPTLPFTRQPVADSWQVNLEMKKMLRESFGEEF